MTLDTERRPGGRTAAAASLALAALVWAAATVVVAVPDSVFGMAALWVWPAPAVLLAAILSTAVAVVTTQWAALAPLAIAAAPLLLPGVAGAWTLAGPGQVLVWAMVVAALAGAFGRRPDATSNYRRHASIAGLAAAVWLGGVAAAVEPFALTGDAPHYLTIARSLLADGDLDLRNDYDDRTYRDFYAGSLEPRHTNTSPWGEHYPFHGIGVSVLVAPAFAVAGVVGATATLVVVMAAASALLWLAAWHLLHDAAAAWFGWAALVLSAPYGLQAAAIYPDGPAAAAVAAALWLLALLQRPTAVPLWAVAAGSLGLAALPWLHVRLALPAGVLGAAIIACIWRTQPDRLTRVAWFLAVPIISCAGWVGAAQVMFGTWDPSAAMLQRTAPGGWADMTRGLLGLAADLQYGLLTAAPVMAAGAWAAIPFARTFPLIGVATFVAAAGVTLVSSFWVWWGGDSAPARFLTVMLPALALWLAALWSRASLGGRRALGLALAMTGGLTVLYATIEGGARAYTFPDGYGSIFDAWSPSVNVGLALPSLFRGEPLRVPLLLAAVWLIAGGAGAWIAARLPSSRGEGAALGLGGLAMLVAIAVAAEVGWRVAGVTPWTPSAAALSLAQQAVARGLGGGGVNSLRPRSVDRLVDGLRLRTPESVTVTPPTIAYVPNVPAGEYDVEVAAAGARGTQLRLELGRDAWPFASWTPADPPPTLTLHTALHSVRVLGDTASAVIALRPRRFFRRPPAGEARRATRYGPLTVYSMDDNAYVEATGLWTGGDRATRQVVAAPAGGHIDLTIEAALGAAEVTLTSTATERISLAPGERRVVPLAPPGPDGVVDLRVDVHGGFPAAALGNPNDSRRLGVWLAFSAAERR